MLVPALVYKDKLEKEFARIMYNDDFFYYMGYAHGHEMPNLDPEDNHYRWAILGNEYERGMVEITPIGDKRQFIYDKRYPTGRMKIIGYFAYRIYPDADTVCDFGLYSFDKGNPLIGHDVFKKMEELVLGHHRVEWRCIGGNPANRPYNRFAIKMAEKYGVDANIVKLNRVTKDNQGRYHDEYIYEIVEV